ncbi:hypothetical protein GCM10008955_16740 [Deinococcus malanensis]|uniref:Endonuclease/exonuclease/phosphatase domain-containing protein n=1 Tax=Deinococcus malanensis TaxID=1706855 RepID=A0ABQ2EW53_9DEIO|nr:endonuclease/exonuclease/phosphatase family protein [Deinococcus malanensis]GGK23807.1 hypothetical protein GCM10008955_16740 [Deinococcus malanensis]
MLSSSRVAWAYLGFVALVMLLGELVAERTIPTLLLAYAPPVLWLLPAPVVLLWTFGRRRGIGVALASTLLAAWGAGLLNVPLRQPVTVGPSLRVLTYNVARGTLGAPDMLAQTLKAADADIILLQESNFVRASDITVIKAALPGYRVAQAHEVTTFTRLPLLDFRRLKLPRKHREVLVTRLRWNGQPLTVVNAHLGTVMLSSALEGDLARIRRTRDARTDQIRVLTEVAAQTQGRLLLGGDLNTPPRGQAFRLLRTTFGPSAHDVAGWGPGWTFPSLKLRIDHVMGRELSAALCVVEAARGSDHRPLLTRWQAVSGMP